MKELWKRDVISKLPQKRGRKPKERSFQEIMYQARKDIALLQPVAAKEGVVLKPRGILTIRGILDGLNEEFEHLQRKNVDAKNGSVQLGGVMCEEQKSNTTKGEV